MKMALVHGIERCHHVEVGEYLRRAGKIYSNTWIWGSLYEQGAYRINKSYLIPPSGNSRPYTTRHSLYAQRRAVGAAYSCRMLQVYIDKCNIISIGSDYHLLVGSVREHGADEKEGRRFIFVCTTKVLERWRFEGTVNAIQSTPPPFLHAIVHHQAPVRAFSKPPF